MIGKLLPVAVFFLLISGAADARPDQAQLSNQRVASIKLLVSNISRGRLSSEFRQVQLSYRRSSSDVSKPMPLSTMAQFLHSCTVDEPIETTAPDEAGGHAAFIANFFCGKDGGGSLSFKFENAALVAAELDGFSVLFASSPPPTIGGKN